MLKKAKTNNNIEANSQIFWQHLSEQEQETTKGGTEGGIDTLDDGSSGCGPGGWGGMWPYWG